MTEKQLAKLLEKIDALYPGQMPKSRKARQNICETWLEFFKDFSYLEAEDNLFDHARGCKKVPSASDIYLGVHEKGGRVE